MSVAADPDTARARLESFTQSLTGQGMSEADVAAHRQGVQRFAEFLTPRAAHEGTEADVRTFIGYLGELGVGEKSLEAYRAILKRWLEHGSGGPAGAQAGEARASQDPGFWSMEPPPSAATCEMPVAQQAETAPAAECSGNWSSDDLRPAAAPVVRPTPDWVREAESVDLNATMGVGVPRDLLDGTLASLPRSAGVAEAERQPEPPAPDVVLSLPAGVTAAEGRCTAAVRAREEVKGSVALPLPPMPEVKAPEREVDEPPSPPPESAKTPKRPASKRREGIPLSKDEGMGGIVASGDSIAIPGRMHDHLQRRRVPDLGEEKGWAIRSSGGALQVIGMSAVRDLVVQGRLGELDEIRGPDGQWRTVGSFAPLGPALREAALGMPLPRPRRRRRWMFLRVPRPLAASAGALAGVMAGAVTWWLASVVLGEEVPGLGPILGLLTGGAARLAAKGACASGAIAGMLAAVLAFLAGRYLVYLTAQAGLMLGVEPAGFASFVDFLSAGSGPLLLAGLAGGVVGGFFVGGLRWR